MAYNFFDTSALGKHYHPELGTSKVDQLLDALGDIHTISRSTVVEMHSVFAKKVRTGVLTMTEFNKITRRFRGDVAARRIRVIRLLVAHFHLAEQLLRQHAPTKNLRTLDALQLAVAIRFNAENPIQFVCADQPLCVIATVEGLNVINPENP
jgi:predicted nucleic acid-binding protein